MRRILSVLLENESGALSRVIGLFSQRGYNIESLTVAPTDDPTLSRMTIQTVGDENTPADDCVTVRDRDTMEQVRIPISELKDFIARKCDF